VANKIIGDTAPIPDVLESLEHAPSKPATPVARPAEAAPEFGGRPGLDPTRYGDWEKNGRCIDF
jgi:hypothetical protein